MPEYETGSVVAARYRLERALAQGGMGSVWVARHLQLDVDVAVKFMAPEFASSPDLRARFEREAKAAAMLKSPNAVQIYDYGIEDGAPYIVMELLEGEDLSDRLGREGRLSLAATRKILEDVGRALRRAHELGLVHRDMKPANIFICGHGSDEVVKIVDFGIAKATGVLSATEATQTGAMLGSPRYMSPEQVRSSTHVDHRTDLWSLGIIAFRCVTGQFPLPGGEVGEVLVGICTAPIQRASEVAPELGPEVDRFFERALMRPVEQRFQSAQELVAAFSALPGAHEASSGGPAPVRRSAAAATPAAHATEPAIGANAGEWPTLPSSGPLARSASGRRTLLALLGGVAAALGVVVFLLLRGPASAPAPAAASAAPAGEPTSVPASPPATAVTAPPSAAPSPPTPEPAPAAAPSGPPKPRRPASAAPRRSDDLLKHM